MPTTKSDIAQFIAWGTVMFSLLGIFIILFLFYYRRRHLSFQRNEQAFQQTLLRTQLEIQEQTMKDISQEIHDNVGQILSLAKLQLSTAGESAMAEKDEKIRTSKDLVAKAIRDLRSLSHSLNTDYISETGLAGAIGHALTVLQKSGMYKSSFSTNGMVVRLEDQKELIIFRIVQELLNNIIKHSGARLIEVKIDYQEAQMVVSVRDDGQGFELTQLNDEEKGDFGIGIRNMNNRARMIGAQLSLSSTLGNGTTAMVQIPYGAEKHSYHE